MHATGDGTPKNLGLAIHWYRMAAERGYAHAQKNLAGMYATGEGMKQDVIEAMKWLTLSSEQDNPEGKQMKAQLEPLLSQDVDSTAGGFS